MFEKFIEKELRKQERKLDDWLSKRGIPSKDDLGKEGVQLEENLFYCPDKKDEFHSMEILKPIAFNGKEKVLINIHGGGLLLGKKEENRASNANYAKHGFTVYSLNYPLAPHSDVFTIFHDLTMAINKIANDNHRKEVILFGDSAGAYLSVYLSAFQNNPKLIASLPFKETIKPKIKALGLISGMFYTTKLDSTGMFLPKMIYGKEWKKHPFHPCMNPDSKEISSFLPPSILVTGKGDFLRGYSKQFYRALKKNGNDSVLMDMVGEKPLPHAFASLLPELEESKQANNAIMRFFASI